MALDDGRAAGELDGSVHDTSDGLRCATAFAMATSISASPASAARAAAYSAPRAGEEIHGALAEHGLDLLAVAERHAGPVGTARLRERVVEREARGAARAGRGAEAERRDALERLRQPLADLAEDRSAAGTSTPASSNSPWRPTVERADLARAA